MMQAYRCMFLGHEDDGPDFFFGEIRCLHCGSLAPLWAHVGATCDIGGMAALRAFVAQGWAQLGPILDEFREALEEAARLVGIALAPVIEALQEAGALSRD